LGKCSRNGSFDCFLTEKWPWSFRGLNPKEFSACEYQHQALVMGVVHMDYSSNLAKR